MLKDGEIVKKIKQRWSRVCQVLGNWDGESDSTLTAEVEVTTLKMVEKNIYHKSPKEQAIVMKEVC